MKLPYGLADFYKMRQEGYFYQDRTRFIRVIEERGTQLVFLRPRRFGKSLSEVKLNSAQQLNFWWLTLNVRRSSNGSNRILPNLNQECIV